jgi:hypothetical protein
MLVGDRDRERVVEKLKQAYVDGRLTLEELGERTSKALAARTIDDLRPVLAGLPGRPPLPALAMRPARGAATGPRPIPAWPLIIAAIAVLAVLLPAVDGGWRHFPPFFAIFFFGWFFLRPGRRGRRHGPPAPPYR